MKILLVLLAIILLYELCSCKTAHKTPTSSPYATLFNEQYDLAFRYMDTAKQYLELWKYCRSMGEVKAAYSLEKSLNYYMEKAKGCEDSMEVLIKKYGK